MKKILLTFICLAAGLQLASAQSTTVLYQEDFGTVNGGTSLAAVGWSQVLVTAGYSGMYTQGGATDQSDGDPLPSSTLYFGGNGGMGIFYTTNGAGDGTGGDSAFTSIDPTQYTNLNLTLESQFSFNGANLTCYFAAQVAGSWYVCTNHPLTSGGSAGNSFFPSSLTYDPTASNWNNLTISSSLTIGSKVSANLSGLITGIGVVEILSAPGSWDFNNFLITTISNNVVLAPVVHAPPLSQTVYAGGGVSFSVNATGTPPFTYTWQFNSTNLTNGGRIFGATTNTLTISNVNPNDVGSYSVIVSNSAGSDNSANYANSTLTVNPVPSDYLYVETFPYVGPLIVNYPVNLVGWSNSIPDNAARMFQTSGGDGAVFAFEGSASTVAFYTTTASDTGASGLPFVAINPASFPAVSFSVDIAPTFSPADVTAYFAVQMAGSQWFVNQSPIPVNTATATGTYTTYAQQFFPDAAEWNTLTLGVTSATIGAAASSSLTGNITGAGLVFVYTGSGNFNFDNFLVTTDSAPPIGPTVVASPFSQTAYLGAGVSFAVSASGTRPLSYQWQLNSVPLTNSARISGATSNVLTVLDVNTNDQGQYDVVVTNSAGSDDSANYVTTELTIATPPSGLIYAETFPFVGPGTDSEPVSLVGWGNAIPNNPNRLFQNAGGDGAVFAYQPAAATTAFFATSTLDPGTSGLPFPNINTAFYPSLSFSVDIAPSSAPTNVSASLVVQMNGGAFYVSTTPLPVDTSSATGTFSTYTQAFNPAPGNWANLTVTPGSGATVGSMVTSNLTGSITGAGLAFTHVGSGGTFNFDNFLITGTGIGGVGVASVSAGNLNLSWVGAPSVHLQSSTNLAVPSAWQDVTNTLGQNSVSVPVTGPRMFFRLSGQ